MAEFECRLKKYRRLAGLTQEELATRVGVRPSLKLAIGISRAVGAPIEEIFIFE